MKVVKEELSMTEIIKHLQKDGDYNEVIIIQVKKDNTSLDYTSASIVNEKGEFSEIERFKQIGILESAKDFVKTFQQSQDLKEIVLDELDLQIAPQLAENYKVGDSIQIPDKVFELHMQMKEQYTKKQ